MLRDRGLQFFHVNEEFPVSASHKLALITSLPFVHTARRYYRLNDRSEVFGLDARYSAPSGAGSSRDREDDRTRPFRGSKSRNKVSVGEPAEGSLETGPRYRQHLPVSRAPYPTPWPRALATSSPTARAPRPPDQASTERWLTSKDHTAPSSRVRARGVAVEISSKKKKKHTRPRTADHLARGSMKTAAICASSCNPQVIRTSTSRTHIAASVTRGSRATPV